MMRTAVIAALAAGMILCKQPTPGSAGTAATPSHTNTCQIESTDRLRKKSPKEPRLCRDQPAPTEPKAQQMADKCQLNPYDGEYLEDATVPSVSCRGPAR